MFVSKPASQFKKKLHIILFYLNDYAFFLIHLNGGWTKIVDLLIFFVQFHDKLWLSNERFSKNKLT